MTSLISRPLMSPVFSNSPVRLDRLAGDPVLVTRSRKPAETDHGAPVTREDIAAITAQVTEVNAALVRIAEQAAGMLETLADINRRLEA